MQVSNAGLLDGVGGTVLHCAAYGGNLAVVDRLLAAGSDVHAVTLQGRSLLHYAASGLRPCCLPDASSCP